MDNTVRKEKCGLKGGGIGVTPLQCRWLASSESAVCPLALYPSAVPIVCSSGQPTPIHYADQSTQITYATDAIYQQGLH